MSDENWQCAANKAGKSDPPQDCDAPYCGCNPAWSQCMEWLQEAGWKSPDEHRAALIAANTLADRCEHQNLSPMCRDALLAYREACK